MHSSMDHVESANPLDIRFPSIFRELVGNLYSWTGLVIIACESYTC